MPRKYLALIVAALLALMVVIDLTRPAIPVDETRYLTVAWEYMVRESWVLPTLNFEPYHHKPPVLFWLIKASWSITGGEPTLWAARLAPLLATFLTLFLTYHLGRRLYPQTPNTALVAILMFTATPFFLIYSSLIMFDTLLAAAVVFGIYHIWRWGETGRRRHILAIGLAMGLGILIKGPVMLLHLIPLMILWPWIHPQNKPNKKTWYAGLVGTIVVAASLALAWALPAAHLGGPAYSDMIFWGQSAGRITQSFDHAQPFWFYFAVLPFMLIPWIFVPCVWQALSQGIQSFRAWSPSSKFLAVWIIPVFVAFLCISGKQAHYLTPLLPGLFLGLAHLVTQKTGEGPLLHASRLFIVAMAPFTILLATLWSLEFYAREWGFEFTQNLITQLALAVEWPLLITLVIIISLAIGIRQTAAQWSMPRMAAIIMAGQVLAVGALHLSVQPLLQTYYDLRPVAAILESEPYDDQPWAVANEWHGELGFLAKQPRAVAEITPDQIKSWLDQNPSGVVILRHHADDDLSFAETLYSKVYRSPDRRISLLKRK